MSTIIEGCTLEVDHERGVIYIHGQLGTTLLRICRLPTPIPDVPVGTGGLLDVTHMHGASWGEAEAYKDPEVTRALLYLRESPGCAFDMTEGQARELMSRTGGIVPCNDGHVYDVVEESIRGIYRITLRRGGP